jgi:DNA-binding MarR family transcriptional regulator
MNTLPELILDHLSRYPISLKKVVETLFPDYGSPTAALTKLIADGLVQRVTNGLDGNYSYYQLTQKGAKSRNLPVNRAREKEAKGLAQDLASLWFSCMGEFRRKRLSAEELKTLFGAPKGGNVIHVAQDSDEETTVFRLFIPSATSALRPFIPSLKKNAHDALADERLLGWVERGTYRFAVLVHSDERREDLGRLIRGEEFPNIRIHLDVAPTPSTLRQFITPETL